MSARDFPGVIASRITRNAAECAKCGDVIESKHRHDFVACKCGAIFVDGGLSYLRWGGNPENIIDRSVFVRRPAAGQGGE